MLRRLIDGAVLAILAWLVTTHLDAGQIVIGLAIAAVVVFTVWRIHRLWRKYQQLRREFEAAQEARLSDDPIVVERAERVLRQPQMLDVANMTVMSGFVLGGAARDYTATHDGGAGGGFDGESGYGAGDFGGGDLGGGFGGGDG